MPGKIKVKVLAGRNLPVMDRASDTTDAFVEIKFGGVTHKTDVCRKSLNPHWNSTEWYRFEVDESELQDEPLQLRLMDHDTYSANDAIGKVVISLAPLLAREANNVKGTATPGGAVMSGWIPVFDTMHGIRGELNVIVKVELFSDFNKYKTSSVGVQFFHCPMIPPGYRASSIHGFVEELIVNDDPEYQWIDKIRTPRASNEARQVAFIKLSNQVQRLVGLKAAMLGANAVVGYQQHFDLEGEAGVVARAVGTAVSVSPASPPPPPAPRACTQQQLKKCLDILATNDESVTDLNQYYRTHQDELQKMLSILNPNAPSLLDDPENVDDDDDKLDTTLATGSNNYAGSVSIYQDDYLPQKSLRHLSEDQTDLNKLLRNDDESSDSSGPIQKIKRIKKHLFSKKFSKRKGEKEKQDDSISLQSNTSDTSRMSLVDIKNEFKKLKRLKKPKFRKTFANKEDEGEGMASILARSIIHVHSSLACIAETQDSESPNSTIRHTSESEPTVNVVDDKNKINNEDKATDVKTKVNETEVAKVPEIHFSSLKNVSSDDVRPQERERRISESCPTSPMSGRSENLLNPSGDYFGSVSSALSGESSIYTSSEEDEEDESSDRSDTEDNLGTTTSIVENVLKQTVNPAFIAQMDRKLSGLENVHPNVEVAKHANVESLKVPNQHIETKIDVAEPPKIPQINESPDKIQKSDEGIIAKEPSTSPKGSETCVKPHSHFIKIHNPFAHRKHSKSISAPSSPERRSFVYRSSRRIKKQLLDTKNNMIKSLSHYSLLPKKKHENKNLSNPSSSSDVPSRTPSDTVLGSHFLSYSDLLNLDKEGFTPNKGLCKSDEFDRPKFSMYIGSEPVSRASISGPYFPYHKDDHDHHRKEKTALKPTGLIHTAMETILIDKVDTLLATSPDPNFNTKFFDDVSERLEEHKNKEFVSKEAMSQVQSSVASTTPRIVAVTPKRLSEDLTYIKTIHDNETKVVSKQNVEDVYGKKPKKNTLLSDGHSKTLLDKMHQKSSEAIHMLHLDNLFHRDHKPKSDIKSGGLVHTAMQTMLMDRAQAVIPDTPEPIPIKSESIFEHEHKPKKSPELRNTGLIHTAMQTMLIDKVQSVMPEVKEPVPIIIDDLKDKKSNKSSGDEIKPTGLLHSAFETILMDKVQTLVSPESEITIEVPPEIEPEKVNEEEMKSCGLIHTALETILVDRAQALVSEPLTLNIEDDTTSNTSKHDTKSVDSKLDTKSDTGEETHGLVHTAMETMLIDKIQTLFPETDIIVDDTTDEKQETSTEAKANDNKEEKVTLIGTALNTMLIDQVNSMLATTNTESKDDKAKPVENIDDDNKPAPEMTIEKSQPIVPAKPPTVKIEKDEQTKTKPSQKVKDTATTKEKSGNKPKETQDQDKKSKKLIRQDSVHSITEKDAREMSRDPPNITYDQTRAPVLQHFHPILSEQKHKQTNKLETIPSIPESTVLQERSLDSEFDTNSTRVCGNSHAACGFDRSEKERDRSEKDKGSPKHSRHESYGGKDPGKDAPAQPNPSLNSTSTAIGIHHRRSSDSDLSVTPKGGSLNTSAGNVGSGGGAILKPSMNSNNLDMLEYPFLTMTEFPTGFVVHIGGTVCSRSVKLVDGGGEGSVRAAWWAELRTELRAHARALRCNAVLAYTDTAAICEDVCVLSASGTAAVINLDCDFNVDIDQPVTVVNGTKSAIEEETETCGIAHVPYSPGTGPYRAELSTCGGCRRARVPAVLLATCEKPNKLTSYSKAVTLTAVAGRARRAGAGGEPGARDVSDVLPFLEYELHKLLLAKLRMQGANAIFSLQTRIAIGERCVMAVASGTAFRLTALPPPTPPRIKASENDKEALEIQRALWETFVFNKTANGYDVSLGGETNGPNNTGPLAGGEPPVLELCADKDACVLELDEAEDVETARLLCVRSNGLPAWSPALTPRHTAPLTFVQVSRGRLVQQAAGCAVGAERCVVRALHAAAYKLRRVLPAAIHTAFQLELPEDEIQLVVSGTAIPLVDPSKIESITENGSSGTSALGAGDGDDDIFELDEEQLVKATETVVEEKANASGQPGVGNVSLTTLDSISGARGTRRVCALRLLFVRETTCVRELGGLSGFLHTFTSEVLAIVRACTAALGGNALTSFYITQLMLQDNAHKNQGQCLLSVGGDVVHITY